VLINIEKELFFHFTFIFWFHFLRKTCTPKLFVGLSSWWL